VVVDFQAAVSAEAEAAHSDGHRFYSPSSFWNRPSYCFPTIEPARSVAIIARHVPGSIANRVTNRLKTGASFLKSRRFRKAVLIAFCVIAPLWILACAGLYSVMRKPPETFGRFMTRIPAPVAFLVFPFETLWTRARSGTLRAGDPAPDFTLMAVDKSGQVQLSSFAAQGKPVVLVFGSYT
jgi:hypothetical protein